jgi:hypothetical protein
MPSPTCALRPYVRSMAGRQGHARAAASCAAITTPRMRPASRGPRFAAAAVAPCSHARPTAVTRVRLCLCSRRGWWWYVQMSRAQRSVAQRAERLLDLRRELVECRLDRLLALARRQELVGGEGSVLLSGARCFPPRPHLLLAQAVHGVGGVLADLGPREVRVAVDGRLRLVVEVDEVLELQRRCK